MEENKKSNVLLLILLVVVFVLLIGIALFFYFNDDKKEDEKDNTIADNYNLYTYKTNGVLEVIDDKYLVDYDNCKIMDLELNTLYDGEEKINFGITDIDGNVYFINNGEDGDKWYTESSVIIYEFKDNKLVEVLNVKADIDNNLYNSIVYYVEDDTEYLYGVVQYGINHGSILNLLNGSVIDLGDLSIVGYNLVLGVQDSIDIINKDYIVVTNDGKYGIYDIKNKKIVGDLKYQDVAYHKDNLFMAKLNGKYGIIDSNLNTVLDFNYDGIFDYAVLKDGKVAVLDDSNKVITDFIFDYQGTEFFPQNAFESLVTKKVNDKYLIIINGGYDFDEILDEAYVVSSDGSYSTIKESVMYVEKDFVWSYIDGILTVYDMNFNKLYDVSVSNVGDVEKHGTYLVVDYYKDTETSVESQMYIDYSTGEVKDNIEDIKVNYGKYTLSVNVKDLKVKVLEGEEVLASYEYNSELKYNLLKDDTNLCYIDYESADNYSSYIYTGIIKGSK